MANNRKIATTSLDFDDIKSSLKAYMQGQSKFSDYDFDGSALSVLLDVLAYNTHYNALYTNLAINEAFLDSASKRSSAVSKAKELGYVPTSAKASEAVVKVTMVTASDYPDTQSIAANTPFSTTVDSVGYTFYTTAAAIATEDVDTAGLYVFEDVTIKEGTLVTNTFEVTAASSTYSIPNSGIDTATMTVSVQGAASSTAVTYTRSDTFLEVSGTSLVYFLKEIDDNFYEIEFGNDVVGAALDVGSTITVSYIIPNEDLPNGARSFTFNGTTPDNTTVYTTTTTVANSGAAPEDVDTIKFNAPRQYTAQNRCVTIEDYKTVIQSLYPTAESINVWGGEDQDPPDYGNVYIAIKPAGAEALTDTQKKYILDDILAPRKMINIYPQIVDPDYLYVSVASSFYFEPRNTTLSVDDLKALVLQTIIDYDNNTLSKFGGILKYSVLSNNIDDTEDSISSSITTLTLQKIVEPILNKTSSYTVDFGNPILNSGVSNNAVHSSAINLIGSGKTIFIDDVPIAGSAAGTLRAFYYESGGSKTVVQSDVGLVYYDKGLIQLNDITLTGVAADDFRFIVKPQSNDVVSVNNQIVTIPDSFITVTAVVDKPSNEYKFTSSRS